MKAKVDKVKKTSASKLVGIKKTKADVQKAKTPKKEVKASSLKLAASGVASPPTFAEKKVLSVKRKAKAAKTSPESISNGATVSVKPKFEKSTKTATASGRKGQPAAEKDSTKVAAEGTKKKNEKEVPKEGKKSAAVEASEVQKSPQVTTGEAKKVGQKRRHGKAQVQVDAALQPREIGPVAEEVTEEALALVPDQLISAANFKALFEFMKKKTAQDGGNNLFGDDLKYSVFITAVKIPQHPARNCRISLPHSTIRSDEDTCLIVADLKRGRKYDYSYTVHHWQDKLRELGVSSSVQIIPFQQLKQDYVPYEMKLKLVHRYSRFMADRKICRHVYGFLGSHFVKRKKNPIPVDLGDDEKILDNIQKALRTETYRQTNMNKQTSIKFAAAWMPVELAVENGMALLEKLKYKHPGGWLNIQSLHLTTATCAFTSFPLYFSVIDPNLVPVPHMVGPREKFFRQQDETMRLATGGKYGITRGGLLTKIIPEKKQKVEHTEEPEEGNPQGADVEKVAAVDEHITVAKDADESKEEDSEDENYGEEDEEELSSEEDE